MKLVLITLLFSWACIAEAQQAVSPQEGFKRLMQGNERYVKGTLLHPDRDQERRSQTATIQKPFAVILGCSDSRVPPEILFDQGIGDLFIVRVAGNVVGPIELASIEYAAIYLGATVLVVLGHEKCGAVDAVLGGNTKDIEPIATLIEPAIKQAKKEPGSILENAIKDNVKNVVDQLEKVPLLADLIKKKKFLIEGGYYDLRSGKVDVL